MATLSISPQRIIHRRPGLPLGRSLPGMAPIGFHKARTTSTCGELIADATDAGLVTIAGTGAGKGRGQVIPALLSWPGSMIVIDPKGELAAVTSRYRRELGQKVVVLAPFSNRATDGLNPLDSLNPGNPYRVEDAMSLARQMTPGERLTDPFWEDRAHLILTSTLLFIATHLPEPMRRLEMLRRIWCGREDRRHDVLAMMMRCGLFGGLISDGANEFLSAPDRTRGSILSTIQNAIGFLASPGAVNSLAQSTLPLSEIVQGGAYTIYLTVPPHLTKSHGVLLRLWLKTLIGAVMHRERRPEVDDLFLVDEAAQVGPMEELLVASSLLRGYGLRTWTFWQSIGQIRSIHGERALELLDNAGALSMFGAANASSEASIQQLTGWEGRLLGQNPNRMILARAGERPAEVLRLDYLNDPEFAGRFDTNPFHQPLGITKQITR